MDETLGFLLFALKKQRALPFWGPAYTAHLEVEYKAVSFKIPMYITANLIKLQTMIGSCQKSYTVQHVTLLQPFNASTGHWCMLS